MFLVFSIVVLSGGHICLKSRTHKRLFIPDLVKVFHFFFCFLFFVLIFAIIFGCNFFDNCFIVYFDCADLEVSTS